MAAIGCHSNQSSYPIGAKQKNTTLLSSGILMLYVKLRIGFMASEEMSFENVDDDGLMDDIRTTGACLYSYLTYEPSAQVS